MKAITIWPEWSWAIKYLGKDVENRTWEPHRNIVGTRIALHAGKGVGGHFSPEVKGALPYYDFLIDMAKLSCISNRMVRGEKVRSRGMPYVGINWYAEKDIEINGVFYKVGDLINEMFFDEMFTSTVFATARIESSSVYRKFTGESRSPWAADGQYTWKLNDLHILDNPIKCRGWQSLWTLSPDVEVLVRRQDPYDSMSNKNIL